jgi:arylsulfatase A-like enzyme
LRGSRASLFGLALLSLLLAGMWARYRWLRPSPTNVLLIVVDTLRADRLGAYGNEDGLTPFLDQLAERATLFVNAYAASSWTCPSVASLFTSRYPVQHNVVTFGSRLAEEEVTIAERLTAAGYVNGGFSANFRLLARLGYAQGFRHWRADVKMPGGLQAAELNRQGLEWLDGAWVSGAPSPVLIYFQYMEPHSPYTPSEPYLSRVAANAGAEPLDPLRALETFRDQVLAGKRLDAEDVRFLSRRYDAEVAEVDDRIRALFAALRARRFLDNAIIVVTSDHGEEFAEHGLLEHGKSLFEDVVRVPLIIAGPGIASGRRVEQRVSLTDVAPTLLDLLGLPAEPRFEGRSLTPLLRNEAGAAAAPDILMELHSTEIGHDARVHRQAIIRGNAKAIIRRDGTPQSYDLAADPGEHAPDPATLRGDIQELLAGLRDHMARLRTRRAADAKVEPLDESTKEKLRALGYLND